MREVDVRGIGPGGGDQSRMKEARDGGKVGNSYEGEKLRGGGRQQPTTCARDRPIFRSAKRYHLRLGGNNNYLIGGSEKGGGRGDQSVTNRDVHAPAKQRAGKILKKYR